MKTISVMSRKGGSGKTTTALALIYGLAQMNYKVLAIDLDPQLNLTYSLEGDPTLTPADFVLKTKHISPLPQQARQNIYLIPGSKDLTTADIKFTDIGKQYRLKEALAEVSSKYDYCIIDNCTHLGITAVNSLTASDYVIVPATADTYSMQGVLELVTQIIHPVQKYTNKKLQFSGVLITMFDERKTISRTIRSQLQKYVTSMNSKVFETVIHSSVAIQEAQLTRDNLLLYGNGKSRAIQDYNSFIAEFLGGIK